MIKRAGFTLLEILVVTLIMGILVLIAIPQVTRFRERGFIAAMVAELRALHWSQESYFAQHLEYATAVSQLDDFQPTNEVTINFQSGGRSGWTAEALHSDTPVRCAVFAGRLTGIEPFSPAVEEGVAECTDGSREEI